MIAAQGVRPSRRTPAVLVAAIAAAWALSVLAQTSGKAVLLNHGRLIEGAGTLRVGDFVSSEMAPYAGADGSVTTLQNTVFSTVPGSPAYVSKASKNTVNLPEFGMVWSFEGRNAIQSDYRITFTGER